MKGFLIASAMLVASLFAGEAQAQYGVVANSHCGAPVVTQSGCYGGVCYGSPVVTQRAFIASPYVSSFAYPYASVNAFAYPTYASPFVFRQQVFAAPHCYGGTSVRVLGGY